MDNKPCRPRRVWAAVPALVLTALAAAACGTSQASPRAAVPPEFRPACGHPGAHVPVREVPVTVRHAGCDLTGVVITYRNYGGATVPSSGGGAGTSSGFTLTVHPGTLDVTVDAKGPPGNA
jgi:hypothetical protein